MAVSNTILYFGVDLSFLQLIRCVKTKPVLFRFHKFSTAVRDMPVMVLCRSGHGTGYLPSLPRVIRSVNQDFIGCFRCGLTATSKYFHVIPTIFCFLCVFFRTFF